MEHIRCLVATAHGGFQVTALSPKEITSLSSLRHKNMYLSAQRHTNVLDEPEEYYSLWEFSPYEVTTTTSKTFAEPSAMAAFITRMCTMHNGHHWYIVKYSSADRIRPVNIEKWDRIFKIAKKFLCPLTLKWVGPVTPAMNPQRKRTKIPGSPINRKESARLSGSEISGESEES